ncbi:hypothetical protein [Taibaiella lutea]|uniref:hypothetical protein n=1 Tax=Taibaiella lutea TaxID=2608001 RepID=UPI00167FE315|nr:hypothetical protein [Taibaiella lutea]
MSDVVEKHLKIVQEPFCGIAGHFLSCARMCEFKKCCKKYKHGKRCKKCPKGKDEK